MATDQTNHIEIALRAEELYAKTVGHEVEHAHKGEFAAIDVDTGDFECDLNVMTAISKLRERQPASSISLIRVGYPYAHWFVPENADPDAASPRTTLTEHEKTIPLTVQGGATSAVELVVPVSPRFTGFLSLPPEVIDDVQLVPLGTTRVAFEDGSTVATGVFAAQIDVDGRRLDAIILECLRPPTAGWEALQQLDTVPFAFINWRRYRDDSSVQSRYEYPLYTDSHITGQVSEGLGPYQLLNNIAFSEDDSLRSAVTLRASFTPWLDPGPQPPSTNSKGYHAGDMCDEIAALLSLNLGARFKAGDANREFRPGGDPLGRPIAYSSSKGPIVLPRKPHDRRVIPGAVAEHSLNAAELLAQLGTMTYSDVVPLIIAARQYQNGLWIAEGEPELTWLMFVSALETAALHWSSDEHNPLVKLRASKPELAARLMAEGGTRLTRYVASQIAPSLGVTSRFVKFVMEFLPPPPNPRPAKYYQLQWSKTNMRKVLAQVYNYRSKALHEGRPFPLPMCDPPRWKDPNGAYAEIPIGLAMSAYGGSWLREDTPMLLHVFEHITRNVLVNWWQSMLPQHDSPKQQK